MAFGKLRKSFLKGVPREATAFKRGSTGASQHIGTIFSTVIGSYHMTLEDSRLETLVPQLELIDAELRGFAYQGAALGLMQLDLMFPWKKRLPAFLTGPASPYIYPVYMGAGVAMARIGKIPEPFLIQLDPVLKWLVIDGYGWHYGIFSRRLALEEKTFPEHLSPYARRIFDQGLGRAIWYSTGADVTRVAALLSAFPEARQPDLWIGVGFACAYAGGAERSAIEALTQLAEPYRLKLVVGAAIAAKGRQRAGNLVPHTNTACEILCGISSEAAAHITDVALQGLPANKREPAYEIWRQRIEAHFAAQLQAESTRAASSTP